MDYRRLGHSDLNVSAVCLGTMTFGQQNTETEAHAQLDYAFSQGVNFVDTAELHPVPTRAETYGRTETFVGTWLRKQARDRVILATKIAGPSRGLLWIRGGAKAFDRSNIRAAIDASLQRLGTDYVDLYQLHWPERNTPMFGSYLFDPAQNGVKTGSGSENAQERGHTQERGHERGQACVIALLIQDEIFPFTVHDLLASK